jgi:hypothetical protein
MRNTGILGGSDLPYPPEEPFVVSQLVRLLQSAKTWSDVVHASDALRTVQTLAASMRTEHEMFNHGTRESLEMLNLKRDNV